MPDHTPQPSADGFCYAYTIKAGDGCCANGEAFGINKQTIEDYHKQTWAKPGTNGCISNCGTDVINNKDPPAVFCRIAYFEGWNGQRSCLKMDASQIDTVAYNTVHFAFAHVNSDMQVVVPEESREQFEVFKKLQEVKRILSFGGWSFSTDKATYQLFRDATNAANRNTFAQNANNFLVAHGLDGLNFDWEYPGAPDIDFIEPGTAEHAWNYVVFLAVLKEKMSSSATLSITLPSSYWYLKAYDLPMLNFFVDYFVYMTYDLHGQWDYGNPWSTPGCPTGNCLRSYKNPNMQRHLTLVITRSEEHGFLSSLNFGPGN
ncbi:hypothetical protein N0V88_005969 [Collariella sp. IMI 366227]|nr:hypothetical protein N0V88_005969 [Collariella sp. IMI 366227]